MNWPWRLYCILCPLIMSRRMWSLFHTSAFICIYFPAIIETGTPFPESAVKTTGKDISIVRPAKEPKEKRQEELKKLISDRLSRLEASKLATHDLNASSAVPPVRQALSGRLSNAVNDLPDGHYVPSIPPNYVSTSEWSEWSQWTNCACGYGSGTRSRTRTCQSSNPVCAGNSDDSQPCDCPQAQWTEWSSWTSCTATCGGGTQTRNRQCNIPNYCTGASSEQQPCANRPCQEWGSWQSWGSCSVTCGPGVRLRNRPCIGGNDRYTGTGGSGCIGQSTEQEPCNGPPCCTEWSQWGSCSVTCGIGQQTRSRECGGGNTYSTGAQESKYGLSTPETRQQQSCNSGECPQWTEWQPGPCSVTCGQGTITRTRQCQRGYDCPGPNTDATPCQNGPCPTWGPWREWQPCTVTCATGTRTRIRQCEGGYDCKGESTETTTCGTGPCPQWTEWRTGPCTVTCGEGEQPMDRQCSYGNDCPGESHRSLKCNPGPCYEWCPWASWGPCAVTCGTGTRQRQRQCLLAGSCPEHHGVPSKSATGSYGTGSYTGDYSQGGAGQAQDYGPHAQGGVGQYTSGGANYNLGNAYSIVSTYPVRSRRYLQGSAVDQCIGDSQMGESCNPGPCAQWTPWQPWTPCSATCGPGIQSRIRTCTGGACSGESQETKSCDQCSCPVWTEWGPWGSCSTDCGYGTRLRTRQCPNNCHSYSPQGNGYSSSATGACPGEGAQSEPCSNVYWAAWTEWYQCSASCGTGYQTRTRACKCGNACVGDASQSQHCEYPCPTPYYPPPAYQPQPQPYQPQQQPYQTQPQSYQPQVQPYQPQPPPYVPQSQAYNPPPYLQEYPPIPAFPYQSGRLQDDRK